jgi:hypothetical protein
MRSERRARIPVMRGLDPRIHQAKFLVILMDRRIAPLRGGPAMTIWLSGLPRRLE